MEYGPAEGFSPLEDADYCLPGGQAFVELRYDSVLSAFLLAVRRHL